MQEQFEHIPTLSPRMREEKRLRTETNGIFAPAKPGFFAERRAKLVEKYVRQGLELFDAEQNQKIKLDIDR